MELFISYSREDRDFAQWLAKVLMEGSPPISALIPSEIAVESSRNDQRMDAIRRCDGLLLVLSPNATSDQSTTRAEWQLALRYKKPVILARIDRHADAPLALSHRAAIDFTDDRELALARLRQHLGWLATPQGRLALLRDRLADARRDLGSSEPDLRARIEREIDELQEAIRQHSRLIGSTQPWWLRLQPVDYANDDPLDEAEDRLDIESDVRTLCTLLAAKQVVPPLSVGLFGDWGSGKSFFMQRMQRTIAELSERSRHAANEGRESYLCENIKQITFNAWHYVDANLWASLITQVFDGLVDDEDGLLPDGTGDRARQRAEQERAKLLQQLETTRALKWEAERRRNRRRWRTR
jgi:hypothetical protein